MPKTQIKATQKQTPIAATKTGPPPAQPTPAAVPQPEKLPALQNTLCEIASELIFNGGESGPLRDFMYAMAEHKWNVRFENQDNTNLIVRTYEEWRRELGRLVPEARPGVKYAKAVPASGSEAVRENLRYNLAYAMNEFVKSANFEDLHFMKGILDHRDARSPGDDSYLVPLANACAVELDRADVEFYVLGEELGPAFKRFRDAVREEAQKGVSK